MLFSKELITNSKHVKAAFSAMVEQRQVFDAVQRNLTGMVSQSAGMNGDIYAANATAILPDEVWREVDQTTDRVMRDDEGQGFVNDLMGISKPIKLGKSASLYRNSSDGDFSVSRSVGGQKHESLNKVRYEHDGDPITVFQNGYGRGWMEWLSHQTEGFDSLADDQEACLAAIRRDLAKYYLYGDSQIVVNGFEAQGITNHRHTAKINLGASGFNIDLLTATSDELIAFFTKGFAESLDDNLVDQVDVMWVSPQLKRRLEEPYANSQGFFSGTLETYLLEFGRIKRIERTFELGRNPTTDEPNASGEGNEFFAYVRNQRVICPLTAAPIGVVPIARTNPMDNFNFMAWGAGGLRIKADFNGKSGVFYAADLG